jgi:pectinesterase
VASIPKYNRERKVVLIKDGMYKEKVRVDASFVTLQGQSREGTRIEFPQLEDDYTNHPDSLGPAVINVNGNNFVLENLTAVNTADQIGPHAFTVFGKGDQTVLLDCNLWSQGADTVALWPTKTNRGYLARCSLRGASDFLCPRGWCYATDCSFFTVKATAAVWHDGSKDREMKFVLRNCKFDGNEGWYLGRHHLDAQFYFIDCNFSKSMSDRPPTRVTYPDNPKRTAELDKSNRWGERAYFYNCKRDGDSFAWHQNNLATASGNVTPERVTAAWTFGGKWDPERKTGPNIERVTSGAGVVALVFDESITVKGKPRVVLADGGFAEYASGSGLHTLQFKMPANAAATPKKVDLNGGALFASDAAACLRMANLLMPATK